MRIHYSLGCNVFHVSWFLVRIQRLAQDTHRIHRMRTEYSILKDTHRIHQDTSAYNLSEPPPFSTHFRF